MFPPNPHLPIHHPRFFFFFQVRRPPRDNIITNNRNHDGGDESDGDCDSDGGEAHPAKSFPPLCATTV